MNAVFNLARFLFAGWAVDTVVASVPTAMSKLWAWYSGAAGEEGARSENMINHLMDLQLAWKISNLPNASGVARSLWKSGIISSVAYVKLMLLLQLQEPGVFTLIPSQVLTKQFGEVTDDVKYQSDRDRILVRSTVFNQLESLKLI